MSRPEAQGLSVIIPVAGRLKLIEALLRSVQSARLALTAPCLSLIHI